MAKNYWIDHSDAAFPAIRHQTHPSFGWEGGPDDLMTLSEARREIKETCRDHRRHWLAVMNYQLSRKAEDLIKEAKSREEQ